MIRVRNADSHRAQALAAGAVGVGLATDYPFGERQYSAEDPWGHRFTFSEPLADVDPVEWGGILSPR
jgi:uncharacterized glyoxalase superfamily protein PhnB